MKRLLSLTVAILLVTPFWAQTKVFNLENPAVQAYMADRTYDTNSDYSVTVIENYNTDGYYSDRDRPLPVSLTWAERPENATKVRVQVSEAADFSRIVYSAEQSPKGRSTQIYNLIPGRSYYYRVQYLTDESDEYQDFISSEFRTEGQVRMLRIDGMSNVRDLGGWATSFGRPLNYGILFRNARTDEVTLAGAAAYKMLGMAAELDLRDDSELTSSPLGEEVDYIRLASTAQYSTGIKNDWQPFVNDFNWIISRLRQGKVLNFHCTAGADRTGTLAWLLEGLLGVGEADLSRDFELTTFDGTWGSRPRTYDPGKGNLGDMLAYIRTFGNSNDLAGCFYNYWINRGAKAEDIAFFRHLMIDEYVSATAVLCSDAAISLSVGDSYPLVATVSPADATYTNLAYASSDESVVTVNADGIVTAVGHGNAYIEVSSLKGEATTVVRVHVAGAAETIHPDHVAVANGEKLTLYATAEKNIIGNGSFEYNNNYFGWNSGASDILNASNFEVVETEAPDGHSYIRALRGDVSASSASILNSWRIEPEKTYVFGYKVKNEKGSAIAVASNLQTSLVSLDSEATGSGDDLGWGDDDDDDANAKPLSVMKSDDGTFASPSVDAEWTNVQYVFNSGKNLYLKVDFSQLVADDRQLCFDAFYLVEADVEKEVDAHDYLNELMAGAQLANYGDEVFQHPRHLAEFVSKALAAAQQTLGGDVEAMADAANSLDMALKAYNLTELNVPQSQDRFNILRSEKSAVYDNGAIVFTEISGPRRPLTLQFAPTGERDAYTLSFVADQKTYFVTFSAGEMVAIANAADAPVVVVTATLTENLYNLCDEAGQILLADITITKAKADVVGGEGGDLGWGDDDDDDTKISSTDAQTSDVIRYSLEGYKLQGARTGLNIILSPDGKARKVLEK